MGKNRLNKTRARNHKNGNTEKINTRDERISERKKTREKEISEGKRRQQELEKKASSHVENRHDSSEDEIENYSSRKKWKEGLDNSSDDDSEYNRIWR